eukprot:GILJ01004856.1.p1 GENE.GILJ01004856.1~~GILJ01004856.1.p1  ORF type:complete len:288 (+),score=17.55 GILJ01004856.1:23-886(+)
MKLFVCRSLWGLEGQPLEVLFPQLKSLGYDAIEASLGDIKYPDCERFMTLLEDNQLSYIAGIYTSWVDYENGWEDKPVSEHVRMFEEQLKIAKSLNPLHINCHSGQDSWTLEQSKEFFSQVLEIEKRLAVTVSHETHRGRILYNPWTTLQLIEQFPDLKLTADVSHWVVVCERLLDGAFDQTWWPKVAERVYHIHARVGYAQHAQVTDPSAPEHVEDVAAHERIWEMFWSAQSRRGATCSTLTPEYGPPPYMQTSAFLQTPVSDLATICNAQVVRQRERFDSFLSSR